MRNVRTQHPAARDQQQFGEEDRANQQADRKVFNEALPQFGEVHIQHHDDEQEQHRDRADINHDQDHRQELGVEQHEQPRRVDEGQDQEQHRVHGVARGHDHHGRGDADAGEKIKEQRGKDHEGLPVRRVLFDVLGNLTLPAVAVRE